MLAALAQSDINGDIIGIFAMLFSGHDVRFRGVIEGMPGAFCAVACSSVLRFPCTDRDQAILARLV
jgi:hypothetical protein